MEKKSQRPSLTKVFFCSFFVSTHYIFNFFPIFSINYSIFFHILPFYMFMFLMNAKSGYVNYEPEVVLSMAIAGPRLLR
jgi:hypothetical protein